MVWTRGVVRRILATTKLDLIHELNPVFSLLSLAFAGLKVPVVLGPHSSRWPFDANGRRSALSDIRRRAAYLSKDLWVREQHRRASAILLSTAAALNNVASPERHLGRLFILPPGVDTEEFSPAEMAEEPKDPTILFLANISMRKGIFTLLEAFDRVAKQMPPARLIIAGDGPSLPAVRQHVEASGYRDRVEFLGRVGRGDVAEVVGRCSVYCLPSRGEPFGITAIEAMACGKPLVVTSAGGLGYIVSDDGGRRVPVDDAGALAAALIEVLQNRELRRRMGEHNRQQVETTYAWPRVATRLELIYREVLSKTESPNPDRLTIADILEHRRRSFYPSDHVEQSRGAGEKAA
jgi:glycosyltransferase involved in cell wall biosynthesis